MKRQHQNPYLRKGFSKQEGGHKGKGHHHEKKGKRLEQQWLAFQKNERVPRQDWHDRQRHRPKEETPVGQEKVAEDKEQRRRCGRGKRGHRHRRQMQQSSQSILLPPTVDQPDINKRERRRHWKFSKFDFQSLHPFGFHLSFISKWFRSPQHHPQPPLAAHKIESSGEHFPNDPMDKVSSNCTDMVYPLVEEFQENYSQKSDSSRRLAAQMGSIPNFVDALRNCSFFYQRDINQVELEKKIKLCIQFIAGKAAYEYQQFRKFIHEKTINLINNSTFTHASHQNPYILMNTSIRNSSNLKEILKAYFVKNQPQTNQQLQDMIQSVVRQEFKESLKQGNNIRYKNFERKLQSKVDWLTQQCNHLFEQQKQKSEEKDIFTFTVNHILYSNTVEDHIKELSHLARSNPGKDDHMIKESFSDIAYKIFLVYVLKQCLKMAFEKQRPVLKKISFNSKQARKALYYSAKIAQSADIPQFQEVTFDRKQQHVDFCSPRSLPFFEADDQTDTSDEVNLSIEKMYIIQDNFYCHYFIELMNFLKSTLTQGITVQLTKNNLTVFNLRMKFAVQQPLSVVKTHQQLEAINPDLSNVMKMIQQKQPQIQALHLFCKAQHRQKQKQKHVAAYANNLKFALRVLRLISLQLQCNTSTLDQYLELNCDYLSDSNEKIRIIYDDLLRTFKSIKDPSQVKQEQDIISQLVHKESFQVDDGQKDAYKLIQAIMIMKITIITYKFYQLIDNHITYRKFLAINKQITSRSSPLSTIYINLFSHNFYLQSITEDNDPQDQQSPKTWEQEYNNNLMDLLYGLQLINQGEYGFTGLHGIRQFNTTEYGVCTQFTTDLIDHQQTVLFAGLPRELARELLIKVCMPVQNKIFADQEKKEKLSKNVKKEDPLFEKQWIAFQQQLQRRQLAKKHKEKQPSKEPRQFTSIQAEQLIKTLLMRIKVVFDNATNCDIRVPLFLLRHFMIDNKLTKSNFANPIPRLNILQAYMDTNIRTNLYNPNFAEQFYLNRAITKLTSKLSTKSHNQVIQAIFILSLTTETSQLQYLKSVRSFIKDKMQRQSTASPINIQSFYSKMTTPSKDQIFWYLEKISHKTVMKLSELIIKCWPETRNKLDPSYRISDYFNQVNHINHSQGEQTQQYYRHQFKRARMFSNISLTNQIVCFIQKLFYIQEEDPDYQPKCQRQFRQEMMIRQLLLLQYKNMKHLYKIRDNPQSLIKNIILILSQQFNGSLQKYEIVIQTEDHILQSKRRYPKYFQNQEDVKSIINRRSDFYYSMRERERTEFIRNLLKIIIQTKETKINLFNVDIATITIVPNQRSLNIWHFLTYEMQQQRLSLSDQYRINVKPIFDEISVCRVYDQSLSQANNRVYQLYETFDRQGCVYNGMTFKNKRNVFTSPSYFERARQNSANLFDENAEDIGNIGLIICSLLFNQRNYYSKRNVNRGNFLQNYVEWINLLQISLAVTNGLEMEQMEQMENDIGYPLPSVVGLLHQLIVQEPYDMGALTNNDQQFLPFLFNLVHPSFSRRTNITQIQNYLNSNELRL